MNDQNVFRPEAEAVLRRPEQLVSGLRLVNPGYLAAVATLCLIVVASIVAAAFIKVPIRVTGAGVILSSKGVLEFTIASAHEGRITDMLVDAWTTSNGPDIQITAGTLLEPQVLTEHVSVLGLLVPALKELLSGPNRSNAI